LNVYAIAWLVTVVAWALAVLAWLRMYRLNKLLMAMNHELIEHNIQRHVENTPLPLPRLKNRVEVRDFPDRGKTTVFYVRSLEELYDIAMYDGGWLTDEDRERMKRAYESSEQVLA
jgi:hypothetical protein